jgi:hypothetical protein
MNALTIEATIEKDGELHLTKLPLRKWDRVEATVRLKPEVDQQKLDEEEAALEEFLALAEASTFCSEGRYPTRDFQAHQAIDSLTIANPFTPP